MALSYAIMTIVSACPPTLIVSCVITAKSLGPTKLVCCYQPLRSLSSKHPPLGPHTLFPCPSHCPRVAARSGSQEWQPCSWAATSPCLVPERKPQPPAFQVQRKQHGCYRPLASLWPHGKVSPALCPTGPESFQLFSWAAHTVPPSGPWDGCCCGLG